MTNPATDARQRAAMRKILFWVFILVFSLTAALALTALFRIIVLDFSPPAQSLFERFAWALWVSVLLEVVAIVLALSRNLFELSEEPTVADLANRVSEVVDGLESNGLIPSDVAEELRLSFEGGLGVSGTVRGSTG